MKREGAAMNRLYYVRFYSHSMNCNTRFLWSAESREALDALVESFEKESSFRVQVVLFICETREEIAETL